MAPCTPNRAASTQVSISAVDPAGTVTGVAYVGDQPEHRQGVHGGRIHRSGECFGAVHRGEGLELLTVIDGDEPVGAIVQWQLREQCFRGHGDSRHVAGEHEDAVAGLSAGCRQRSQAGGDRGGRTAERGRLPGHKNAAGQGLRIHRADNHGLAGHAGGLDCVGEQALLFENEAGLRYGTKPGRTSSRKYHPVDQHIPTLSAITSKAVGAARTAGCRRAGSTRPPPACRCARSR